jgi:hypothetical protein
MANVLRRMRATFPSQLPFCSPVFEPTTDHWGVPPHAEGDAESPGSAGASPYLRQGSRITKPGASKLSCPLGLGAGPSGRMTGAKHFPGGTSLTGNDPLLNS